MRIRSITFFSSPAAIHKAGRSLAAARQAYSQAGYEVQSLRLAFPPFAGWMPSLAPGAAAAEAQRVEREAAAAGIAYVSIGPAMPEEDTARSQLVSILAATQNVFCSASMGDAGRGVYLPAVRGCAEVIQKASSLSPDGFTNLRFAAMANVPAGSPFFPAAYSTGKEGFALAVEGAGLAVEAFSKAKSLEDAANTLVESIEDHGERMAAVGERLQEQLGVNFAGIDFSLAPFPEVSLSLGEALERLGVPAAGSSGSLAAAAMITSCVDRARIKRTGFSGLFLPVLEDAVLAKRAADGSLTITDLLLLSSVCGTGLDTIPLPGNSRASEIAPLLLDLAALACRLDKPLTARLMPVPGKIAGDETGFDFAFFARSRVMQLKPGRLSGLLAGDGWLPVKPRMS